MHLHGHMRRLGSAVVVELDGDADLASAPELAQVLARAIDSPGIDRVVVDLDALTVLDDVALGQLVGAAATARRRQLSFAVVCTNERVRERFDDTRLDQILDLVDRP
jgi:anti-anti-sigma factor